MAGPVESLVDQRQPLEGIGWCVLEQIVGGGDHQVDRRLAQQGVESGEVAVGGRARDLCLFGDLVEAGPLAAREQGAGRADDRLPGAGLLVGPHASCCAMAALSSQTFSRAMRPSSANSSTAAALEAEGAADGGAAPDRFVDEEALAVEPPNGLHLAVGKVREQVLVEGARLIRAMARSWRPAHDVVLDIFGQRRKHALYIVARLEAEVFVQLRVHQFMGQHYTDPPV